MLVQKKSDVKAKAIKEKILRDSKNLFEHEEDEHYYNLVRASNFWSNNYIEYESNHEKNKATSVEENINKIRSYLKDTINNLKKYDL